MSFASSGLSHQKSLLGARNGMDNICQAIGKFIRLMRRLMNRGYLMI